MTAKRSRCIGNRLVYDYGILKQRKPKYDKRWEKDIRKLCRDFLIPDEKIDEIIIATKANFSGRERSDLMYNYAQRRMMQIIY